MAAVPNQPLVSNKRGLPSSDGFHLSGVIYSNSDQTNAGPLVNEALGIIYLLLEQHCEPRI